MDLSSAANPAQFDAWNGESGHRWAAVADQRDAVLAPVADILLAAAELAPGSRVLDVGCGCGALTFAASSRVGAAGRATGVDLSEPMLDVARQRAERAGGGNVSFVQADVQVHPFDPGSLDHAISRFGTMFFADPAAAFSNIAAALVDKGRLTFTTWQPLDANPWLTVPRDALSGYGRPPATDLEAPGMFAQADPDVIAATLDAAGFGQVTMEPTAVTFALGRSSEEAADYIADTGVGRVLFDAIGEAKRAEALAALESALADHHDDTAVRLGGAIWLVSAVRGG